MEMLEPRMLLSASFESNEAPDPIVEPGEITECKNLNKGCPEWMDMILGIGKPVVAIFQALSVVTSLTLQGHEEDNIQRIRYKPSLASIGTIIGSDFLIGLIDLEYSRCNHAADSDVSLSAKDGFVLAAAYGAFEVMKTVAYVLVGGGALNGLEFHYIEGEGITRAVWKPGNHLSTLMIGIGIAMRSMLGVLEIIVFNHDTANDWPSLIRRNSSH